MRLNRRTANTPSKPGAATMNSTSTWLGSVSESSGVVRAIAAPKATTRAPEAMMMSRTGLRVTTTSSPNPAVTDADAYSPTLPSGQIATKSSATTPASAAIYPPNLRPLNCSPRVAIVKLTVAKAKMNSNQAARTGMSEG